MASNLSEESRQRVRVPESLPPEWEWAPLVEICRPRQWPTISKDQLLPEGFTVFGANGPIGFFSEFTHPDWTLAITCRGATCGTINVVPPRSYITGNAMALDELERARVVFDYLRQALVYRGLADIISGSAQPQITRQGLAPVVLPLPPLGEQVKIAAILSSMDDAIEATKAVIGELQVVKKAMMAELLTRGLPGRHTRYKMTEIGEVPEAWEVVNLGALLKDGPDNGLYKPQSDYGDGTPIVRIDAFDHGDALVHDGLRRVRATPDEVKRFAIRPKEILLNRVNSLSHLAKATFVTPPPEPTLFESNMMRLAVDDLRVLPSFVFRVIVSDSAKEFFLSRAKQAVAQASVNQQDVRALPIPLPSKDEQVVTSQVFERIDERLTAETDCLAALVRGKESLMSVLLTGEVRVKPDEAA